ncbi:alpha/beta fold hydrolase [Streptomyces sp. AC627_RSS907]|uniref:alpha/beta fold hydrolase n=1 Tax=Streptomyces sp. AC627_RSS907 TaxID=2823684 RepID=UPI001C212B9E|nr:alpha/beta hydrolase [Streptomyces sp. AC627_RSS907]
MSSRRSLLLAAAASPAASLLAPAVTASAATSASPTQGRTGDDPVYTEPIGIGLEGFPSPFPFSFLRLVVQGEIVNMAYMDVAPSGRANGQTVTLLHGKNFDGGAWAPTARALAKAGYRVVIPDQIGFGRSSKPAVDYGFAMLADNTAALLDHLGVDRTHLVAHSMGGMLATRFALRHPRRTLRVALANPVGLEDYRELVPEHTTEKLFADELGKTDQAALRAFYRGYVVRWRPEYERNVEIRCRVTLSAEYPRWAMAAALTYQTAYHQPVVHEFGRLRAPVLLVIGQEDRTAIGKEYATPADRDKLGNYPVLGKRTAEAIPDARLVELPGVGHNPQMEAAGRFQRELTRFFAG